MTSISLFVGRVRWIIRPPFGQLLLRGIRVGGGGGDGDGGGSFFVVVAFGLWYSLSLSDLFLFLLFFSFLVPPGNSWHDCLCELVTAFGGKVSDKIVLG